MPTVAEHLRRGREACGLSVSQVADATKMRADHVRALDEGDYSMFVAPVYIRGFVRTYATLVKLDVAEVMATLDAELSQNEKFREPPSLGSEPPGVLDRTMLFMSRIRWRIVLPIGAVLLAILLGLWGYRAWTNYRNRNPLKGVGSGVYQPKQKTGGDTLPLPPSAPARK
jgi:cytoskeleton protein RodZ